MDTWIAPRTVYEDNLPPEPKPEWEVPEEGTYVFQLYEKSADTPVDPKFNPDGTKMQAKFFFHILDDPDYEKNEIMQFFTISFNELSKLRPFVEAGIGRKLLPTDRVGWVKDPSDPNSVGIGGMIFRATLTHSYSKTPPPPGQERKKYAKLSSPLKLKPKEIEQYTGAAVGSGDVPF